MTRIMRRRREDDAPPGCGTRTRDTWAASELVMPVLTVASSRSRTCVLIDHVLTWLVAINGDVNTRGEARCSTRVVQVSPAPVTRRTLSSPSQ